MKQTLVKSELFAQSMSRKEFLRFFTLAVLTLFGFNNFMGFINSRTNNQQQIQLTQKTSGHGFGSSRFGA